MADTTMNVIMNIISKVSGADKIKALNSEIEKSTSIQDTANSLMKASGLTAGQLKSSMGQLGLQIGKNGKVLDAYGNEVENVGKQLKDLRAKAKRFDMSMLSILFAAMALKRAMTTLFRSMLTSYDKANGEQSAFRKETNKLIASWEFFKYSIIDALAQSAIFKALVNWVFVLINGINSFLSKHPNGKVWLGLAIIFTIIAASVLLFLAQVGLAYNGLGALSKMFGVVGKAGKKIWGWITKAATATGTSIIAIIVGVGLILAGLWLIVSGGIDIFRYWGEDWSKVAIGVIKVLAGIGLVILGILVLVGTLTVGWALAIAAIIAIVAFGIIWIIKHWTTVKIWFLKFSIFMATLFVDAWTEIKVIFFEAIRFIIVGLLMLNEASAKVSVLINQGFVWLWYLIKKGAIEATKFVVGIFLSMAEDVLNLFGSIPLLDRFLGPLKSGIKAVKSSVDEWGSSLEKVRDEQLKVAEGPLEAAKKLTEVANQAFDDKIALIRKEAEEQKKAISSNLNAEIDAIKKVQAEQEAANKAAEEQKALTTGTAENKGILGGALDKFMPNNPLSQFTSGAANGQVVQDNRTQSFVSEYNISGDPDTFKAILEEHDAEMESKLNQSMGSGRT